MSKTWETSARVPESEDASNERLFSTKPESAFERLDGQDDLMVLLAGIADHIVVVNEGSSKRFRAQLDDIARRLRETSNRAELIGETLSILEAYAARANRAILRQKSEMNRFTSDLSDLMKILVTTQPVSKAIRTLGTEIERASEKGELPGSNAAVLRQALEHARGEVINTRKQVGQLLSSTIARVRALEQDDTAAGPGPGRSSQTDTVTGLPGRSHAEAELAKIHAETADRLLALFAVKRLDVINAKFGYLRGDQVLLRIVQHLAQAIPDSNTLFRWTPCSFLMIVSPSGSSEELRKRVQMISSDRVTMTLEWEGRTALVPVAVDGQVLSSRESASLDSLCRTLDGLAVRQ